MISKLKEKEYLKLLKQSTSKIKKIHELTKPKENEVLLNEKIETNPTDKETN